MNVGNVRALVAEDAAAARALMRDQLGGSRYALRLDEQLERAISGADVEYRGFVALSGHRGHVNGVALFGRVAGAGGVVKVHALVGRTSQSLLMLAGAILECSASDQARLIVCELADDPLFVECNSALRQLGFAEDAFIPDWYSDGLGMFVLARRDTG
ncbi:MAG: hypothetical protein ABJE47_13285 [bacterium]